MPPKYALPASRYSGIDLVRVDTDSAGNEHSMELVRRDGRWCQRVDWNTFVPLPGARNITARDFVGTRFGHRKKMGNWIEVPGEVARTAPPFLAWCRRLSTSELPDGAFLIPPDDWEAHLDDELDLPFLPEFDHPRPVARRLAAIERRHRAVADELAAVAAARDDAIRTAARAGMSRRAIGDLIGLSWGRIQQIIHHR